MEKLFEKKTAIITGGSSGIGKATAMAFAARGANVVVADVQNGSPTADQINDPCGCA